MLKAVGDDGASSGVRSAKSCPLWDKLGLRGGSSSCRGRARLQRLSLDNGTRIDGRLDAPANSILSSNLDHDRISLNQTERARSKHAHLDVTVLVGYDIGLVGRARGVAAGARGCL